MHTACRELTQIQSAVMEEPRAYTLEVFVKSVHAPGQTSIKNCLGVAVRFLDFPMLLVRPGESQLDEQAVNGSPQEDAYVFSSGKSCVFSSQPDDLAAQLSEASLSISQYRVLGGDIVPLSFV